MHWCKLKELRRWRRLWFSGAVCTDIHCGSKVGQVYVETTHNSGSKKSLVWFSQNNSKLPSHTQINFTARKIKRETVYFALKNRRKKLQQIFAVETGRKQVNTTLFAQFANADNEGSHVDLCGEFHVRVDVCTSHSLSGALDKCLPTCCWYSGLVELFELVGIRVLLYCTKATFIHSPYDM